MKKTLLFVALGMMSIGTAVAKDSTGCGLGTMIFDGKSGVAPQVLAVTTNGTLGNQTFGITSGTLGCDQNGVISSSQKLGMFTGSNLDKLAQNMAAGEGEALATLADLMGIADEHKDAFYATTKAHFDAIFVSSEVTAEEVLTNLRAILAKDAVLSRYVS
ncbi:MAG TPA: DUF3015 domain-containing protein [Gammaproteobacteria bacterium]|nr:DUF3015 domain-containing protein [Gammaproteobacteria bacterium]